MRLTAKTFGFLTAFALSAVAAVASAAPQAAATLPNIRVLATGGTIAGAPASAQDYGYKSGAYDVNTLIRTIQTSTSSPASRVSRWSISAART